MIPSPSWLLALHLSVWFVSFRPGFHGNGRRKLRNGHYYSIWGLWASSYGKCTYTTLSHGRAWYRYHVLYCTVRHYNCKPVSLLRTGSYSIAYLAWRGPCRRDWTWTGTGTGDWGLGTGDLATWRPGDLELPPRWWLAWQAHWVIGRPTREASCVHTRTEAKQEVTARLSFSQAVPARPPLNTVPYRNLALPRYTGYTGYTTYAHKPTSPQSPQSPQTAQAGCPELAQN
ncbi:hypothetical protein GGR50DRAFT_651368 [Xylaria sp. CBS 124048]|nr:hypothetical protein GGR50DRAFT_651368 [Xylaria sp. CBS 124048]